MSFFGRKEIAALKAELAKKEQEIESIKELLTDVKIKAEQNEEHSECRYYMLREKLAQDRKLTESIYVRKYHFMSMCEYKLYKLLCEVSISEKLKKYGLIVFAQVRLADIVRLRENTIEDFKKHIKFYVNGTEKTNRNKEQVYSAMENLGLNDDDSYKQTFLYPLMRSHVDFLICRPLNKNLTPLMVIELFGEEHFDYKNKKLQSNDEFKKLLFEAIKVSFDNSVTNEAIKEASKDENKRDALKLEFEGKILGSIRDDSERIAKSSKKHNEENYN